GRPTRAQASRVDRSAMPMSPRGVIERRHVIVERRVAPQAAAGSTVVLRGSRSPAFPNLNAPGPNLNGAGYGSSQAAGPVLQPGVGWDRDLDYGGLDYGGATPPVVSTPPGAPLSAAAPDRAAATGQDRTARDPSCAPRRRGSVRLMLRRSPVR